MTLRPSAMLRYWRHVAVTCVLIGCSDGISPSPGNRLSGTWSFAILFDQQPAASGSGTLTFVQPDGADPTLRITGSFTATPVNGTFTTFRDGTLSADNTVRFRVEAPYPWQFEAVLSNSGRTLSGRHTLVGGGLSGAWNASKQGTGGGPPIP